MLRMESCSDHAAFTQLSQLIVIAHYSVVSKILLCMLPETKKKMCKLEFSLTYVTLEPGKFPTSF